MGSPAMGVALLPGTAGLDANGETRSSLADALRTRGEFTISVSTHEGRPQTGTPSLES